MSPACLKAPEKHYNASYFTDDFHAGWSGLGGLIVNLMSLPETQGQESHSLPKQGKKEKHLPEKNQTKPEANRLEARGQ